MRTPEPSLSGSRARRSMPQRKAASVFPDPVGAQIRLCAPDAIAGQPAAWAGVGASNEASNQRRTGSEKGSRGDFWVAGVLMANLLTLPTTPVGHGCSEAGALPIPKERTALHHRLRDEEERVFTDRSRVKFAGSRRLRGILQQAFDGLFRLTHHGRAGAHPLDPAERSQSRRGDEVDAPDERAILAADFEFRQPLTYFLQVRVKNEQGVLTAYPEEGGGSGDFTNLTKSDGFLELPLEKNQFKKGEAFPFIPYRDSFK